MENRLPITPRALTPSILEIFTAFTDPCTTITCRRTRSTRGVSRYHSTTSQMRLYENGASLAYTGIALGYKSFVIQKLLLRRRRTYGDSIIQRFDSFSRIASARFVFSVFSAFSTVPCTQPLKPPCWLAPSLSSPVGLWSSNKGFANESLRGVVTT